MHYFKYLALLVLVPFGCSPGNQLPKRKVAVPTEDNLYAGSKYRNNRELLSEEGVPSKPVSYFNELDFRGFYPLGGRIMADPPYDKEKDLGKIPEGKIKLYHELTVDHGTVESLSELLFKAKRPVLNQFYTGKETYRFILTRDFRDNYIFEMYKKDNQAFMYTAKITSKLKRGEQQRLEEKEMNIPLKQFNEFKAILTKGNFWAMEPHKWVGSMHGSNWTIEAHTPFGYKVLSRIHPDLYKEDELLLRKAGQWLINKSKIEVKNVY